MAVHTLLGGNGTIGSALYPLLLEKGESLRLVSRSPLSVNGAESMSVDVLDWQALVNAVAGSDIVYLLIGMTYDLGIWKRDWPRVMENTIEACKAAGAKLIFFDNAYMYGRVSGPITEATPYNPSSKKGAVRGGIARMLEEEMKMGRIEAAIVRAVDFYGPGVTDRSIHSIFVFANLSKGRPAFWPVNADVPRSLTYVPDAARAIMRLVDDTRTWGQVWHLPTALPPLTGREIAGIAARSFGVKERLIVLPKWLLKVCGWFVPIMGEVYEMLYQDEFPFLFSSEKFEKAFNYQPVSYEEGIRQTAEWFKRENSKAI